MEGDAGTSRLNPTDDDDDAAEPMRQRQSPTEDERDAPDELAESLATSAEAERLASRPGGSVAASALVLLLLAAAARRRRLSRAAVPRPERGDRPRRRRRGAGAKDCVDGDPGPRHRGDGGQPGQDHRVLDG